MKNQHQRKSLITKDLIQRRKLPKIKTKNLRYDDISGIFGDKVPDKIYADCRAALRQAQNSNKMINIKYGAKPIGLG
jgi:hypothetical protein